MFSSCMPKSEINKITEAESLLGFLYPYSLTEHNTRQYNLKGLDVSLTIDQALIKLKQQLDSESHRTDPGSIEVNISPLWEKLQVLAYLTYLKNKTGVWDSNHNSKQQISQNQALSHDQAERILRLFSGETALDEQKRNQARKQLQAHSRTEEFLDDESSSPLLENTQASSSPMRVKSVRKEPGVLAKFGIGSKRVGFQAEINTNETQHINLSIQYLLNTYGEGKGHEGFKSLKDIYRQLIKSTSDELEQAILITDAWSLQEGDNPNEAMAITIVLSEIKKALAILCNNHRQLPDFNNTSDNTKLARALARQQRQALCPLPTLIDHQLVQAGIITAQSFPGLKGAWSIIKQQINNLFNIQGTSTKLTSTQDALKQLLTAIDAQNPRFNTTDLLTAINNYLKNSPLPFDELQVLSIMQQLISFYPHEEKSNRGTYVLSIQPGIKGMSTIQSRINTLVLETKLIRFAIAESRAQRTKPLGDSSAIAQLFNYCLTVPYSHYAWSAINYCMSRDAIKGLDSAAISRILNNDRYRVFKDQYGETAPEQNQLNQHEQSLIQVMVNYQAKTRKLSPNKYSARRDKHAQQAPELINSLRSFFHIKRKEKNLDTYAALENEDSASLFSLEHADNAVEQYTQAIEQETNDPEVKLARSSAARLLLTNGEEETIYVSSITYIDPLTLCLSNLLMTRPVSDAQYEVASVSYLILLANALNNKGNSDAVKAAKQRLLDQIFQQLDRLYAQLTNTSDVAAVDVDVDVDVDTVPLEQLYCYRMLVDFIHSDKSFRFLEKFHALKKDNSTPIKKYRALLEKHNANQPVIFYKALVTDASDTDAWNRFQNIEFDFLGLMLTQLDNHIQQAQQTYLEKAQPLLEHTYKLVFKYLYEAHQTLLDKLLDAIEQLNNKGFDINAHRTAGLRITEEDIKELKTTVKASGELAETRDQELNARLKQQVYIDDALSSEVGNPLIFMPTKTKDKIIENSWLIRYIIARINQAPEEGKSLLINTLYGENPTFFESFAAGRHSNYKAYLKHNQLPDRTLLEQLIREYDAANSQLAGFFNNYEQLIAKLSTTIASIQNQPRHYRNNLSLSIDAAYAESRLPKVPKPNYNENPDAFNRYLKLLFEHQPNSVIDFLVTENLHHAHSQLATYLAQIYRGQAIEIRVENSDATFETFRLPIATLPPANLAIESKRDIANAWQELSAVEENPAAWHSQLFKIHQAYTAADITEQQAIAIKIAQHCHNGFKVIHNRPDHATLALDMLHLLIQSNSDDLDLMIELADAIQHPEAYCYIDANEDPETKELQGVIGEIRKYIFNYAPEETSNPHLSMASSRGSAMRTSSQRASSLRESLSTTFGKERVKINKLNLLNELWISLTGMHQIQSDLKVALMKCFQLHGEANEEKQATLTKFINKLTALLAFKVSETKKADSINEAMVTQAIAQLTQPQELEVVAGNINNSLIPQMKTNWLELRKTKLLRDIDEIKIQHESPDQQAQKLADTLQEIDNLRIKAEAINTSNPAQIRIYFALWKKLCKLLEKHPELIGIGNTKQTFNLITQGFFQDLHQDLVHPVDRVSLIHYVSWQYNHGPNSEYLDQNSHALNACLALLNRCLPVEFENQWTQLFQIISHQEIRKTLEAETLSVEAVQSLLTANEQLLKTVLDLALDPQSQYSITDFKHLGEHIDWVINAVLSHVVDFLAASENEIYQDNIKNLIGIFPRYLDLVPEGRGSTLHQLSKELFNEIDYLICSQAKIAVSIIPNYFVQFKEAEIYGNYSQRVAPNIERQLELLNVLLNREELKEQAEILLTAIIENNFPAAEATTPEELESEQLKAQARGQISSYFIDNNVEFSAAITLLANQCENFESFQLLTKLCLIVYGETKTLDEEIYSKHLQTNSSAWRNLFDFAHDEDPDLVDIETTRYFFVANLTMLNNLIAKEANHALQQLAQTAIDNLASIENTQLPVGGNYCEQFEVLALSDGLQEQYKFCNILATGEKYKLTTSDKREKNELVMTFDNNLLCYQLMLAGRLDTGKSKEMFTACALNWQGFSYVEKNEDDQTFYFYPNWEIDLLFNQEAQELLVEEVAKVISTLTNNYVTEQNYCNQSNFLKPRHTMLLLSIANASTSSVYGRALTTAKNNGVEEQFFYQQLLAGVEFIYDTTEEGLRQAGQEDNPVPKDYQRSIEAWAYPVALNTMTNELQEGELHQELMSRHLSKQQIEGLDSKQGQILSEDEDPCYVETFDPNKQTLYRIPDSVIPRSTKQHSTSGESDSSPLSRRNRNVNKAGNQPQKESEKAGSEFGDVIQFIYFCKRIHTAELLPKETAETVKDNATSIKALERINKLFIRIERYLPQIIETERQARMSNNSSSAWHYRGNSDASVNISTDLTHNNGHSTLKGKPWF